MVRPEIDALSIFLLQQEDKILQLQFMQPAQLTHGA